MIKYCPQQKILIVAIKGTYLKQDQILTVKYIHKKKKLLGILHVKK